MPKMKTHSGSKKRFKVTGTGKLMKQQAGMRHNLEVKSAKRWRRRTPCSGRDCSRPRNRIMAFTLSPALRNPSARLRFVS